MVTLPSAKKFNMTLHFAWRSFMSVARFEPKLVTIYIVAAVINVAASVLSIFFVSRILQNIFNALAHPGSVVASRVYELLALSLLFVLIEQVTYRIIFIAERRTYLLYSSYVEEQYNQKLASLDTACFEDADFSGLLARVSMEVNYKPANHAYQAMRVIQSLLRAVVPAIVVVTFAPWMIVIIVLGALPSLFAEYRLSKVQWSIWSVDPEIGSVHSRLNYMMRTQDELQEIKLLSASTFITNKIRTLIEEVSGSQEKAIRRATPGLVAARILEIAVSFGLQLWILAKVIARVPGFNISTFTFYSAMIGQFTNSIGLAASSYTEFLEYNLYMTDFYKVMDTVNQVVDIPNPIRLKQTFKTITFENVSFRYKPDTELVLNNLNVTIKHGDKIAIVGDNGAGKSTLIRLLLRFYYPTSGRILVDGHDLKDIAIEDFYQQIGVLFQTFNKYPTSAGTNIEIGDSSKQASPSRREAAAQDAGAKAIIAKLPQKYQTMLYGFSKKGVNLSGGQWQRIALARAFYRNAPLLILDEPTAAVDANAEYEIFENIRRHQAANTTIIISHRFSTVRQAKLILVLKNGEVVESGSHQALIKHNGLYREMFDKQAQGYR